MAWQPGVIQGTPGSWVEVDYTELDPVTDPAKQRWTKDPQDPEYYYDVTHWKFPGQISTAIVFYDINWDQILPAAAVVQSIQASMKRFLLGGLFTDNDIRDGAIVPCGPQQGNPGQPKPMDRNYSQGNKWSPGVVGGESRQWLLFTQAEESDRLTNTELMEGGFGFVYFMFSETGRMDDINGGAGMAISDPSMAINYIIEV